MDKRLESDTIDGLYRMIDEYLDKGWRERGKINQRRGTYDNSTGPITYYADIWIEEEPLDFSKDL